MPRIFCGRILMKVEQFTASPLSSAGQSNRLVSGRSSVRLRQGALSRKFLELLDVREVCVIYFLHNMAVALS